MQYVIWLVILATDVVLGFIVWFICWCVETNSDDWWKSGFNFYILICIVTLVIGAILFSILGG